MAEKYIKLEDACSLILELSGGFEWLEIGTDLLIEKLKAIPAADVRPVVRGKWMPHKTRSGKNWWECSICGFVSEHKAHHYYCPKCSSRMEATTRNTVTARITRS